MDQFAINNDGIRDPYTLAVERFLELFDSAFPSPVKKQALVQFIGNTGDSDGLFYKSSKQVDKLLQDALSFAYTCNVPAKDRVMLAKLYEDCLRYSTTMNGKAVAAQKILEKAYDSASGDERALLFSLASARDGLFEAPASTKTFKDFKEAVLSIAKQRRTTNKASIDLFKGLEYLSEKFDQPITVTQ